MAAFTSFTTRLSASLFRNKNQRPDPNDVTPMMTPMKYALLLLIISFIALSSRAHSSELRLFPVTDGIQEAYSGPWFISINQRSGESHISQLSTTPLTDDAGSTESETSNSASNSVTTNPPKLNLRVHCGPHQALQISLRHAGTFKADQSLEYIFKYGNEVIRGPVTNPVGIETQGLQNKRRFGLKDRQVVWLSHYIPVVTQRLYFGGAPAAGIELLKNKQVYASGSFDLTGFGQAFDYACGTSPVYTSISRKPAEVQSDSDCEARDKNNGCTSPKNYLNKLLDKSAFEAEANELFDYLESITTDYQYSPSVSVVGTKNQRIIQRAADALNQFIAVRSLDGVISTLAFYDLHIEPGYKSELYMLGNFIVTVRHGPKQSVTKRAKNEFNGLRLRSAIEKHDDATVKQILDAHDNDLSLFSPRLTVASVELLQPMTLLRLSVTNGNAKTTRLILDALTGGRRNTDLLGKGYSTEPILKTALLNADAITVRQLIEAGAMPDNSYPGHYYYGYSSSPIFDAVKSGDVAKVALLHEYGVSLDSRSTYDWTPLMLALWLQEKSIIEYLIPLSDPFDSTDQSLIDEKEISEDIVSYLPPVNTIFLARRLEAGDAKEVELKLVARAKEQSAESVDRLYIHSDISTGLLAYRNRNVDAALEAYNTALNYVDISSIDGLSDGPTIVALMNALLNKHTTLLTQGIAFPDEDRQSVAHLTSIGGWNEPIHDLLDVFHASTISDGASALADWRTKHGNPGQLVWESLIVQDWIDSQADSDLQRRLSGIMEQFVVAQ